MNSRTRIPYRRKSFFFLPQNPQLVGRRQKATGDGMIRDPERYSWLVIRNKAFTASGVLISASTVS